MAVGDPRAGEQGELWSSKVRAWLAQLPPLREHSRSRTCLPLHSRLSSLVLAPCGRQNGTGRP